MDFGIAFYNTFHIKKANIDDWLNTIKKMIDEMSKEKEFICAHLHRDINNPTHFTLYERWNEESMEAFIQNQLHKKPYRDTFENQLPKWTMTPRTFSQLEPIEKWEK
ncbi:putative quinol monooxygenase [Aquimarina mytili]|uniref:Antibiotic biosynthesis monooxygenase n=1 Tax=Aquimarina mytili TaxID=874423 RepID=A0A936ZRE4_9FLAO|nr:antibiotic biosynthesis monooxygenase [Aquimarina mytili]MBL0682927.1 antibiotic biosynthesis monooxygenase [Aquimarina mytili]